VTRPLIAADRVTVQHATMTTDPYGDETPDWGTVTSKTYEGSVQPAGSDPADSNRAGAVTSYVLFLWPPTAVVGRADRVLWGARKFEVDGDPEVWAISGAPAFLRIPLRMWEG
jgi:hypothetical protein